MFSAPGGIFSDVHREQTAPLPSSPIIISHCKETLEWVEEAIAGINVKRLTIYTKCGKPVLGAPPFAHVIKLPNVGRCDHTYALHMANISDYTDINEVHVFMKDTHRRHHHKNFKSRPLRDVVIEASGSTGYSCGCLPDVKRNAFTETYRLKELFGRDHSLWHLTSEVEKFSMDTYVANGGYDLSTTTSFENNNSLSQWWARCGLQMPRPIMPICYSGYFAAKLQNILSGQTVWSSIQQSLERGDNIIEGHYAERTFAALLMPPLTQRTTTQLYCSPYVAIRTCRRNDGYCGMLTRNKVRNLAADLCSNTVCSKVAGPTSNNL